MQKVDRNKRYELDYTHNNNIALSSSTCYWQIVTNKPIKYLDTPWEMDYTHIHSHSAWIQM